MPWFLKFVKPQTGRIVVEVKFHVLQVSVFLFSINATPLKTSFLLFDCEVIVLVVSIDFPLQLFLLFLTIRIVHLVCFSTPADEVDPSKALSDRVSVPSGRLATRYRRPESTDGLNLLLLVFTLLFPFDDVITGGRTLQSFQHGHIFLIYPLAFFT